jgi:Fe-S-cluster-containing dehydrogenase component
MDRREFLKAPSPAAPPSAGTTCPRRRRAQQEMPPEALGLLFDSTLCIGCKACVAACKQANDMPLDYNTVAATRCGTRRSTSRARSTSSRPTSTATGTQRKDQQSTASPSSRSPACTASTLLRLGLPGVGDDQGPEDRHRELRQDACIGCRYCVAACPFGVPRSPTTRRRRKISKCQLCRTAARRQVRRLRRGLPDRRHAVRQGVRAEGRDRPPPGALKRGHADHLPARRLGRRRPEPGRAPRRSTSTTSTARRKSAARRC